MIPWYAKPFSISTTAILMLLADFVIGPYVTFPITFVLPIAMTAWWYTRRAANILTVVMVTARFINTLNWDPVLPGLLAYAVINSVVRLVVFFMLSCAIYRVADQQRSLRHKSKVLEGLLPICAYCKKIRNEEGAWEQLESYLTEHSGVLFSHSICPDCRQECFNTSSVGRMVKMEDQAFE
jgi:hypothetical protein